MKPRGTQARVKKLSVLIPTIFVFDASD